MANCLDDIAISDILIDSCEDIAPRAIPCIDRASVRIPRVTWLCWPVATHRSGCRPLSWRSLLQRPLGISQYYAHTPEPICRTMPILA
jgi:hypothetical protein